MRKLRITPKLRDWLLVALYLGYGGPVLVIAAWAMFHDDYEITPRLIVGLLFFALVVLAGFYILGQRLGLIDEDKEDAESHAL
jgi:hypothetical protein